MKSLWETTSAPLPVLSQLTDYQKADIIVIGAGVAGLSTALHLAKSGVEVAVVEAGQPGSGAAGQSGGLIAPSFIRHSPNEIVKSFGSERGLRLINLIGKSARTCFDVVRENKIECAAQESGFWGPAHTDALAQQFQTQAEEWQAFDFKVRYVGQEEVSENLSVPRYCGALHFEEGGALNPLAYVRGLAQAALDKGVKIFSDTEVTGIERVGTAWQVITAKGAIGAEKIVLAANGGNAGLHPSMRRTVLPLRVFEFATEPLSAELREEIIPSGGAFTDKQPYMFTARFDDEGRLVSAFPFFWLKWKTQDLYREAQERLVRHFPALKAPKVEFLWEGTAWLNPSLLPKIYEVDENIYAVQACNGRGLAVNTAIGQEMASALKDGVMENLSLEVSRPSAIRGHMFAKYAPPLLMTMAFLKSRSRQSH